MHRAFRLPRVEHLTAEPQLASLAVLEMAANVAILALGAEYPELASNVDHSKPLELRAVVDLIELARAIHLTITRYRRDLAERHECERDESDLLPF